MTSMIRFRHKLRGSIWALLGFASSLNTWASVTLEVDVDTNQPVTITQNAVDEGMDFHFQGAIPTTVLRNYLSRIMICGLFDWHTRESGRCRTSMDDDVRMILNTGAKLISRAYCQWTPSGSETAHFEQMRQVMAEMHEADPDLVFESCIFETCCAGMNGIPIPDWVFKAFGQPVVSRNFDFNAMKFQDGTYKDLFGAGIHCPDINQLETQMFIYYRACLFIDLGFEALHLGQVDLISCENPHHEAYTRVLSMIREYAKDHARRGWVLINAHHRVGYLFADPSGKHLLEDYTGFPVRMLSAPDDVRHVPTEVTPQETFIQKGDPNSLIGNTVSGYAPNGEYLRHQLFKLELDNYMTDDLSHLHMPFIVNWPWGLDEISWFANQPAFYRHYWLDYAYHRIHDLDPNGYFEMPGKRIAAIYRDDDAMKVDAAYYYAHSRTTNANGFGDEVHIKNIWYGHRVLQAEEGTTSHLDLRNGVCRISSEKDLRHFAYYVNHVDNTLDACLLNDIYCDGAVRIGTVGMPYKGRFDGQEHTITMEASVHQGECALFGHLAGCVHHLRVDGRLTTDVRGTAGICAFLEGGEISNCISSVTILSSLNGEGAHAGLCVEASDGAVIRDCLFNGSISGSNTFGCAGLVGHAASQVIIQNCMVTADIRVGKKDTYILARNPDNVVCTNNFYSTLFGTKNANMGRMTSAKLSNGEACYKLNADQSDIQWTQCLEKDSIPIPWQSQAKVFVHGNVNCGGVSQDGTVPVYSNEPASAPAHNLQNGICKTCGYISPDYVPMDQGILQISTPSQFAWFAYAINHGKTDMDACLVKDIDLSEVDVQPVGSKSFIYRGTFDGAHHSITVSRKGSGDGSAPFGHVSGSIRNLVTRGTIETAQRYAAGVCSHLYHGSLLSCESYVDILSTFSGDATHAGICAVSRGESEIVSCLFNGSIRGLSSTSCAGIVGWAHEMLRVEDCLAIGEISVGGTDNAVICRSTEQLVGGNNYYKVALGVVPRGAYQVTAEELRNGEACYQLNEGHTQNPTWRQTLTEDEHPVPNPAHQVVSLQEGKYSNTNAVSMIRPNPCNKTSGIYDLMGRKTTHPMKGVYVINGKKYLIK